MVEQLDMQGMPHSMKVYIAMAKWQGEDALETFTRKKDASPLTFENSFLIYLLTNHDGAQSYSASTAFHGAELAKRYLGAAILLPASLWKTTRFMYIGMFDGGLSG